MSNLEYVNKCSVELISAAATDDMVAMAAWVSNDQDSAERLQEKDRVKGLINFLYKNKHMSPFEHGHFTFKVDVPFFVAREFHRHRTASYNEVSGRYTEMKPRFYEGDTVRVQQGKMGNYYFVDGTEEQTVEYKANKKKSTKKAWKAYKKNLELGISKEQSREDLPLSMMTQFYVTMNPRNLMQFLTLRNDKHALKEIRDVAVQMEKIFSEHMPLTHQAYVKGRKEAEFDKTELEAKIKVLESENNRLHWNLLNEKKKVEDLTKVNTALKSAKADIEAKFYDMVSKYNALYVKTQEKVKHEAPKPTITWRPDSGGQVTSKNPQDHLTFNHKLVEDAKTSIEKMAEQVKEVLKKHEERNSQ